MADNKVDHIPLDFKAMMVEAGYLKPYAMQTMTVPKVQVKDDKDEHIADLKERLSKVRSLVERAKEKNTVIVSLADLEAALD